MSIPECPVSCTTHLHTLGLGDKLHRGVPANTDWVPAPAYHKASSAQSSVHLVDAPTEPAFDNSAGALRRKYMQGCRHPAVAESPRLSRPQSERSWPETPQVDFAARQAIAGVPKIAGHSQSIHRGLELRSPAGRQKNRRALAGLWDAR